MIRTNILRQIGGFDTRFRRSQDTDLCVRLAKAGGYFLGIDLPLVTQTMTLTSDKGIERERHYWLALVDKHRDIFTTDWEYKGCRHWINLRHDWLAARRARFWWGLARLAAAQPFFTGMRIWMSLRNLSGNRAFSRFHLGG